MCVCANSALAVSYSALVGRAAGAARAGVGSAGCFTVSGHCLAGVAVAVSFSSAVLSLGRWFSVWVFSDVRIYNCVCVCVVSSSALVGRASGAACTGVGSAGCFTVWGHCLAGVVVAVSFVRAVLLLGRWFSVWVFSDVRIYKCVCVC